MSNSPFPKILKFADGTQLQVNDEKHEKAVLAKLMAFMQTTLGCCYLATDGSAIPLVLQIGGNS